MIAGKVLFVAIALLWSGAVGWYANPVLGEAKDPAWAYVPRFTPKIAFQFMLNFLGCLAGWVCLYYIVFVKWRGYPIVGFERITDVGAIDLTIALIALAGITGAIPRFLFSLTSIK